MISICTVQVVGSCVRNGGWKEGVKAGMEGMREGGRERGREGGRGVSGRHCSR